MTTIIGTIPKRGDLLSRAYVGEPLTLGGRELCLSIGRYSLLEYWRNPLFCKDRPRDISQIAALGELVSVCHADKRELAELRGMNEARRDESTLAFMLDWEDDLQAVVDELTKRMNSIEAAGVVPAEPGKR